MTLVEKLEEIHLTLKEDESKVQGKFTITKVLCHDFIGNKYWKSVARRMNCATFCIMVITEIGVIVDFQLQIKKSRALDWHLTPK